jgi:hypothetical protein
MNMNNKWFAIYCLGLFALIFGSSAFEKYSKDKVQIACYEAAKTNANIKCGDE